MVVKRGIKRWSLSLRQFTAIRASEQTSYYCNY